MGLYYVYCPCNYVVGADRNVTAPRMMMTLLYLTKTVFNLKNDTGKGRIIEMVNRSAIAGTWE